MNTTDISICGVVLLRSDGAALLQLRDERPDIEDPGLWVFPGGHVEDDEPPQEGACREFLEETRYRCGELHQVAVFSGRALGYFHDFGIAFFWTRFDGLQELECCEGQQLRFVRRDEIPFLPRREYLTTVWDLALAASGIGQIGSAAVNAANTEAMTMLSHETITRIGCYRDMDIGGIDSGTLIELWRQMLRLRRTEEALIREYHPADEMRCPIHFCIGQESVPAALSLLVRRDDYLFSHHRSHGYYFAKGAPLRELFAEIYGRQTGANCGHAGSQDISHQDSRFYSGAILAGAISIAVGGAWGLQVQKSDSISIAGFGEGATDEGAFWEAMNYAGCKKLPVLFICENNRYATYSDQLKRQASDNIAERVAAFGVRSQRIFGNDVALTYRTLEKAMVGVRNGEGPSLVEAYTFRWNSHVGPEDDSVNNYRSVEELEFWRENCPIRLLQQKLSAASLLTDQTVAAMEKEIALEIEENFRFAKSSPFPGMVDWQVANWNNGSPEADRVLGTSRESEFDHYQPEAKLEPY